jgi:hypothetical protein
MLFGLFIIVQLKLSRGEHSKESVNNRIHEAMQQMGLVQSASTRCGGTMAGGFEMKGLRSLNVPSMFTECSLNVHSRFLECSLNVHWMFTECLLNVG